MMKNNCFTELYNWYGNLLNNSTRVEVQRASDPVVSLTGIRHSLLEPIKNMNKIHICNDLPSEPPLQTNFDDAGRQDTPYVSVMLEIGDEIMNSTETGLHNGSSTEEKTDCVGNSPNVDQDGQASPGSLGLLCPEQALLAENTGVSTEAIEEVVEEEIEEIEEIQCCICLCDFTEPDVFITKCKHSTCVNCIVKLYEFKRQSIQCPMCRTSLLDENLCTFIQNYQKQKKLCNVPPFDLTKYPVVVNWTFIRDRHLRIMISTAYEAVHHLKKWEFLYYFELGEGTGFIFCKNPEINVITHTVDQFYEGGHSGSSMGGTMQHIHFIAKHGFDEYYQMLLLDRN